MSSKLKLRDLSQSLGATIDARDVAILAQIAILSSISWLAPQRYWLKLSEDLAALRRLVRRDLAAREAMVGSLLQGRNAAKSPSEIVRMADAYYFLERVQLLRLYRPGGWKVSVRLDGAQHIESALAAGKGAILWVAPFLFHRQATKMALARAGYCVAHLSRFSHGFSTDTLFGERCINPIRTRLEMRYLDRRLVIGREGSKDVVGQLEALLRQNKLVSITAGQQARRTCHMPFLNGRVELATAPAFLSHKTGAPLLPVFTVRESGNDFLTRIEPPLGERRRGEVDDAIEADLSEYAASFEKFVLAYPEQYLGGFTMI